MISSVHSTNTGNLWDTEKKKETSSKTRQAAGSVIQSQFASSMQNTRIQDLAANFHVTHMDQQEYDDFLDALVEQNILTEEDKKYVGYHNMGVRDVGVGITSHYSPDPDAMNYKKGDMLAYVKYQCQIIYEPPTESTTRSQNLYRKIRAVMEQMEQFKNR